MDIIDDLQLAEEVEIGMGQEVEVPRRRRKFKQRTCEIFFNEMSDYEFLRTFRFSKEGVRHLITLLGNLHLCFMTEIFAINT